MTYSLNNYVSCCVKLEVNGQIVSEGTEMKSGFSKVNHQTQEWYVSDLKILGDRTVT